MSRLILRGNPYAGLMEDEPLGENCFYGWVTQVDRMGLVQSLPESSHGDFELWINMGSSQQEFLNVAILQK
jgi:hypothetical protein